VTRIRLIFVPLLAAAGLVAGGCGGGSEDDASAETRAAATGAGGSATLSASVGPGFDISLSGTDDLQAGEYTIVVSDKSSAHNFHLTGPGVDVQTDVSHEVETTWTVTLEEGEYRFQCDPHASSMNGTFTVG
jgi:plastocyanin